MRGSARPARRRLSGVRLTAASFLAGALSALVPAACSLDYTPAEVEQEAAAPVPDSVATNLVHRVVRNSRLSLEVTAQRAESWNSEKRTVLSDATFLELDAEGKLATEGRAGSVVFHTDTENAEIAGGVRVYSASEEASVETYSLAWQADPRVLTAPPGNEVVIRRDDGSYLEGSGFVGDFRRREVTFSGSVRGEYVRDEQQAQ